MGKDCELFGLVTPTYDIRISFDLELVTCTFKFGKWVRGKLKLYHEITGKEAKILYDENKHWMHGDCVAEIERLARKYDPDAEVPEDDRPDCWRDRCSPDKCVKCGEYPTRDEGDAFCLQHLGKVMNACCGHGKEGYVQFEGGVTIRGIFTIYHDGKKYEPEVTTCAARTN